jgi:hypothetical protein
MLEKIKVTNWIGVFDNKATHDDQIESCMAGKYVKAMPQEYKELKHYDYLCFLDSKVAKVSELFVESSINKFFVKQNFAMLLRKHWFIHDNVLEEYNESMKQARYRLESNKYKKYIETQVNAGLSNKSLLCACGFIIRNMKHEKTLEINKTWYRHIQECGIQDQISFFFVKQLFSDVIYPFTEYPYL